MIEVSVKTQINDFEKLAAQLSDKAVATATSRAINRALTSGGVFIKKSIKSEFNIKNADLKQMKINKSSSSSLTGTIAVGRRPISLTHFNPVFYSSNKNGTSKISINRRGNKTIKSSRSQSGVGVTFEVFKGKKVNIPYAFMINNDKQKPVFARGKYLGGGSNYNFIKRDKRLVSTGPDLPITKLNTTSVYGAIQNKTVNKDVNTTVMDLYSKRLEVELKNLINRL